MGLFGGGKEIYSSSVVYNMAGDPENRIQYLKTVIATSVINNSKFSFTDSLNNSYINGPGIKTRSFHRWCRNPDNFGEVGVPTLKISSPYGVDLTVVASYVPRAPDQTVQVTFVRAGPADYAVWAEQYVAANFPDRLKTEWFAAMDMVTDLITITWADNSTISFAPVNYDTDESYVYVVHTLKTASSFLGSRVWIYKQGDGIGYLDSILDIDGDNGEAVPIIPIRLEKKFLSDTHYPNVFKQTQRAYTKATGKRGKKGLAQLISDIKKNEDIDDIDHVYMVHGVTLNAKDNSARKYLFRLFDYLRLAQPYSNEDYEAWEADKADYDVAIGEFTSTRDALTEEEQGGPTDPATTGSVPVPPQRPITSIEMSNPKGFNVKGSQMRFVMSWRNIKKTTGTGLGKAGAKVGDVWWGPTQVRSASGDVVMSNGTLEFTEDNSIIHIFFQRTQNSWEKLSITGMVHENYAHRKQPVRITAAEALADDEESGFLAPILYNLLKKMSLVDSTQMMTQGVYLVFNCFTVVKKKWYQTGLFQVFIFIVIIAIAVIFPPSIGLLGPAATIGATLGFTGLMAVIVGTIVNTIAAMILMRLISTVSVAIFGAKIGAIIGAIVGVVAMSFGPGLMAGQGLAAGWGSLMSAQSLLSLTNAIGNGIAGYMKASAMEFANKTQQVMEDYEAESKKINEMFTKLMGTSGFGFDPMSLTDSSLTSIYEPPQMFLDRTLLTGSDIAEMTMDMLNNFASATTSLDTMGS